MWRRKENMLDVKKRINVGCGQNPTPGWINYDNSISVRLAKLPILVNILSVMGILTENQKKLVSCAVENNIIWANGIRKIPDQSNSVDIIYTSHMVEHLDRDEVRLFLKEAFRVLKPNGIIRVVVPDLRKLVDDYISKGDADAFIDATLLAIRKPKSIVGRLKLMIIGYRYHLWMYDGPSLCRLLSTHNFREPRIMEFGSTIIPQPGKLDLYERGTQSVCIEAIK